MNRNARIATALAQHGLDALLIMSPVGTTYLSGCFLLTQTAIPERHAYVLLQANGDASYLVCNIETHSARRTSRIQDIHEYVEFAEKPIEAAARLLDAKGLTNARIGVEPSRMPYETMQQLKQLLPQAELVDWEEAFDQMLMVKDPFEIEAISEAGQATRAAIENGMTQAQPGCTERDVATAILLGIMDAGIMPLFNVFTAGPQLLEAHAEATTRQLQPGELVRVDMGGRMSANNYLSDMARTAVVGEPSAEQATVYSKLCATQSAVFDAMRPGVTIASLFHACVNTFEREGLPFHMPHIGHGMGIGLHEAPMINAKNDTLLEVGMVLNIEPHVTLAERHESYHIEDLVVVTADGCRLLTTPHAELIQIPA